MTLLIHQPTTRRSQPQCSSPRSRALRLSQTLPPFGYTKRTTTRFFTTSASHPSPMAHPQQPLDITKTAPLADSGTTWHQRLVDLSANTSAEGAPTPQAVGALEDTITSSRRTGDVKVSSLTSVFVMTPPASRSHIFLFLSSAG